MLKIIFCQGLPASGKSTWSKKFCADNKDYVRVCRDDLRTMRGIYWIPEQEAMITVWERKCVMAALRFKKNVVIDATNFNEGYVNAMKQEACEVTNNEVEFEMKIFDTPLDVCIMRDSVRTERKVGEKVIRDFYVKYLRKEPKPLIQDDSLPHAIICDLDGTLAHSDGKRGWYDYAKVDNDSVDITVANIVKNYKGTVIFVSGREDSCKALTIVWLQSNQLHLGPLYMRKAGDNRDDAIVKRELFEANIQGKYFIDFVLDDRDKVVKMWRAVGLKCLQVAEGNF